MMTRAALRKRILRAANKGERSEEEEEEEDKPWVEAGKVGGLDDARPLIAAVEVAGAEGSGHWIPVRDDRSRVAVAAVVIGAAEHGGRRQGFRPEDAVS